MSSVTTKKRSRKNQRSTIKSGNGHSELILPLPLPTVAEQIALATTPAPTRATTAEISERAWLVASIAILLVATALRFYALDLKPMHHDEGVNGFFLTNLVRQGVYKYDPTNYHGPTLYYLALPGVQLFGLNTFALRSLTALFGIGTIFLILSLRRYIGTLAALTAAALVSVSPGSVYYSRYFIHESLFAFFTLGIVAAALRFYETRRVLYLVLAATSAALLFATKETAFVSLGTLGLAWLVAWWWSTSQFDFSKVAHSIFASPLPAGRKRQEKRRPNEAKRGLLDMRSLLAQLGGRDRVLLLAVYVAGLFIFVNVLFYSSFFTNWPGVSGALESLKVWANTGTSEFHYKRFDTYLTWLLQEEMPILFLAVAGALIALFNQKVDRFAVFIAAWAFGLLLAYSLIPYKTPWLMLSFIVPMAVIGGYAVQHWSRQSWGTWRAPAPALAMAGLALAICLYQSFVLNFREYDNDQYPYVYAHTNRELIALVSEVERISQRAGTKEIGVSIASSENWPLPWYFRDYPRVGYVGTVSDHYDPKDIPVVIARESAEAKDDQTATLRPALGSDYDKVGTYTLRPGVRLALFARRDLIAR